MTAVNYRQALIDRIETPVKQNEVEAGTVKTAFLTAGTGPPLVLLHGAGAGAVTWYPSIGALAKSFRVVAPDIVGYGESDKPEAAYDRQYFARWLKDFLVAVNIPKAHLVGLSQGGAIALQFALENPAMVDRLGLVSAGALGARPSLISFLGMLWLNTFPSSLANRFYSRFILFNPANRDPSHAHYSLNVIRSKGGKNAFRLGRGKAVAAMPESLLQKITNDTLIIWGEEDQLFSLECGKAASRLMPNAGFICIENAGHLSLIDQPDVFNGTLIEFFAENNKNERVE